MARARPKTTRSVGRKARPISKAKPVRKATVTAPRKAAPAKPVPKLRISAHGGAWRVTLHSANGRVMATAPSVYTNMTLARRAAVAIRKAASKAKILVVQ